ncbi:hypothetical protein YTPLAS72_37380 [Nitrospira sp.]|nr:hypothetical protein YTPLAS72_37380 [Nitrospira sp.]
MSVETEDAFQKELIELFVQEAQEWLQQIHVALDELQQAPLPSVIGPWLKPLRSASPISVDLQRPFT